jgi:hypothetical protein
VPNRGSGERERGGEREVCRIYVIKTVTVDFCKKFLLECPETRVFFFFFFFLFFFFFFFFFFLLLLLAFSRVRISLSSLM